MPEKFSFTAPDEKVLIIRFSKSAGYVSIVEESGQPIDAFHGLKVMMQLATQFLAAMVQQESMLVGQGKVKHDDTKKSNEN